jgi:2,3-diketo-5-methylthio-1-phosphopentane phosphatase
LSKGGPSKGGVAVFSDFDATITDIDTFDLLVRECAGPKQWQDLEERLRAGTLTLREVLRTQAAFVGITIDEADALLHARTKFDPTFAHFVQRCEREGVSVTVLSSGVQQLIERAFARHNLEHITIYANAVDPSPDGWRFLFRDDSDNGHDKAKVVRESRDAGVQTVFCGDGHSDFAAAEAAHMRFAKRGRALESHLRNRGLAFTPFDSFAEIEAELFALASS